MIKTIQYTYLGTNGIITSFIHLEGIPSSKKIVLKAEEGKLLSNGLQTVKTTVVNTEEEIKEWFEIDNNGQE